MGGVVLVSGLAARGAMDAGQVHHALLLGLGCLALGVGLIKPNLVTLVTRLFPSGSSLVDPALARYYAFTNGGAIAGPLVAGYCVVRWGYSVGFAVALIGECFLLGAMFLGWRSLAAAESWSSLAPFGVGVSTGSGSGSGADPVDPRAIRSALAVLVPFFLLAAVGFWPASIAPRAASPDTSTTPPIASAAPNITVTRNPSRSDNHEPKNGLR